MADGRVILIRPASATMKGSHLESLSFVDLLESPFLQSIELPPLCLNFNLIPMDESPHPTSVQTELNSWYNAGRVYSDGTRCMLPGYLGSLSLESLRQVVTPQKWFEIPSGSQLYLPVSKVSIVDDSHTGRTLEVDIPKRIVWESNGTSSLPFEPFKIQNDNHAKALRWAINRAFQEASEEDRISLINDQASARKTVQSWFTTATDNLEDLLRQYPADPPDSLRDESDFDCQDRASCITRLIVRSHPQLPHDPTALEMAMSALHFGEEMDPSAYNTVHDAAFHNPNIVDNNLTQPFCKEVGEIVPSGDPGSVTYGIQALHRHILRLAEKRQDLADLGI